MKLPETLKHWSVKQVLLDKPQRKQLRPRVAGPQAGPLERTLGQEGLSAGSGETESLEPGLVRRAEAGHGAPHRSQPHPPAAPARWPWPAGVGSETVRSPCVDLRAGSSSVAWSC